MERKSKFFWLYTIILFSVAFVLILFSAFSTTNYKKIAKSSIDELKTQNADLAEQKTELGKTVDGLNEKINQMTIENESTKRDSAALIDIVEAYEAYTNKDYYYASSQLSGINPDDLTDEVKDLYNNIKYKVDAKIEG